MPKALARCPVCEGTLVISELTCSHCNARIQSQFESCRFCRLSADHLAFIETFLRCEGNISRVEKEMGLSYPTVRNRLSGALAALQLAESPVAEPPPAPPNYQRRDLLEALARGEISAEEAAIALRELP